jgi:hypothetical protein
VGRGVNGSKGRWVLRAAATAEAVAVALVEKVVKEVRSVMSLMAARAAAMVTRATQIKAVEECRKEVIE